MSQLCCQRMTSPAKSQNLERNLTKLLGKDRVLCTSDALLAWECDGFTVHKSKPRAVVLPESTAEVQAVVKLLHAAEVPFVPRGAGTCLSGGPTAGSDAVIIDCARMRKVLQISTEDLFAVVQPGVVNLNLTTEVTPHGLHYAPDPSSQSVCTIGGNLAENSGGPHCFKYGMTTDHMLAATIVLPDGELAHLGSTTGPRAPHGIDVLGLFCGSEGTFGIATEITVRLCRNQQEVRTMLASFDSMSAACRSVGDIVSAGLVPAALEILDQATIRAVEASIYRAGYPENATAVLLVELDGPHEVVVQDAAEIATIFAARDALKVEEATDAAERKRLWKGRKGAFGAMGRIDTDLYVLDGVVPRTKLEEALGKITEIGKHHRVNLTNVFHAGDGNLHPNISFDGRDKDATARTIAAGHEILQLCMDLGGSITGEHGIGTEKLDHVSMMFEPEDLEVMARVRAVFNPDDLCNPGKVLPQRNACAEVSKWPQMIAKVLDVEDAPQPPESTS
ncbi:MAG: glycolate oxidase subunit GlcD [Planctomycetota bacterium]|jgi:glycolate oxidase subunit GlcD